MAARRAEKKAAMPRLISPQLASLAVRPPGGAEWLHEIKYDGYRLLARLQKGSARLYTRAGNDWTARFPTIAASIEKLPADEAWLDGEVVYLCEDGTSSFQGLQASLASGTDSALVYMAFDLLFLDGADLCAAPLRLRKNKLERLLSGMTGLEGKLRYSEHIAGRGQEFLEAACASGLEGVVSKLESAPYSPGRSRAWRKVKCRRTQEFVIGGYAGDGGAQGLAALLIGVYEGDRLIYCGRVGTGFDERALWGLQKRLKALPQRDSPFWRPPPKTESRGVRWVRPALVAEVEFTEWTGRGVLRHPSFKRLRLDKPPEGVVREYPDSGKAPAAIKTGGRPRKVRLTNPGKTLYPEAGLTKKALAQYYSMAAVHMLPHLSGRPLTLLRCPEGWPEGCFFQKNPDAATPEQINRITVAEKGETVERMTVDTAEGITALVQMGVLEIHTWGSRAGNIDSPDRMTFDLDPAPDVPWAAVIEAAFVLRDFLAALGLPSFVKTTGGKGLHVTVPLEPAHTWREVGGFSRAVARFAARALPERFTSSVSLTKRKGRIFIDYIRNNRASTVVEAFSTRAVAHAPVSAPVGWEELKRLAPGGFTVKDMAGRLKKLKKDPWQGYFEAARPITPEIKKRLDEKRPEG